MNVSLTTPKTFGKEQQDEILIQLNFDDRNIRLIEQQPAINIREWKVLKESN